MSAVIRELYAAMQSLNEFMQDRPINKQTTDGMVQSTGGKLYTPWPRLTPPMGVIVQKIARVEDAVEPPSSRDALRIWRGRQRVKNNYANISVKKNFG